MAHHQQGQGQHGEETLTTALGRRHLSNPKLSKPCLERICGRVNHPPSTDRSPALAGLQVMQDNPDSATYSISIQRVRRLQRPRHSLKHRPPSEPPAMDPLPQPTASPHFSWEQVGHLTETSCRNRRRSTRSRSLRTQVPKQQEVRLLAPWVPYQDKRWEHLPRQPLHSSWSGVLLHFPQLLEIQAGWKHNLWPPHAGREAPDQCKAWLMLPQVPTLSPGAGKRRLPALSDTVSRPLGRW